MRIFSTLFLASTMFLGTSHPVVLPKEKKSENNQPDIEKTATGKNIRLEQRSYTGRIVNLEKTKYELYKEIEPYNKFRIKVSDIHELYVEEVGNPKGEPVLFVHGGPGMGCSSALGRYFDPKHYRVILVDQRGAGKSTPHGEIKENNTKVLIQDFEIIRKKLNIDKWLVFGGSWGSFLGLAYTEEHPKQVSKLILRGQMLGLQEENEWLYQGRGFQMLFPERYKLFEEFIPKDERYDMPKAYFKRLDSKDENIRREATRRWQSLTVSWLRDPQLPKAEEITDKYMRTTRLECYYLMNNGFANPKDQLLKNAHKLRDIPVVIINGQYDVLCPPYSANLLKKAIPHSELIIIPDAGHASNEPGIQQALLKSLEYHKQVSKKPR